MLSEKLIACDDCPRRIDRVDQNDSGLLFGFSGAVFYRTNRADSPVVHINIVTPDELQQNYSGFAAALTTCTGPRQKYQNEPEHIGSLSLTQELVNCPVADMHTMTSIKYVAGKNNIE
ncbi:MAG: hypothetical protein NVS1B7_3620 [Candidatus Saccharimonadales bacterium]